MIQLTNCNGINSIPIEVKGVENLSDKLVPLYKNDVRISDVRSINRLLQRVVNSLLKDEITEGKARTIGYIANIMITGFKAGDLEDRLTELEENINNKGAQYMSIEARLKRIEQASINKQDNQTEVYIVGPTVEYDGWGNKIVYTQEEVNKKVSPGDKVITITVDDEGEY